MPFYLIPASRHKTPLTSSGEKDASSEVKQWATWAKTFPGCNWAIATGPSGLIAVDEDTYKPSYQEPAVLDDLPPTVEWRSGNGGRVRIFQRPLGVKIPSKNGIAPAVDVKCSTGYVLIPPSVNAEGKPYTWVNHVDDTPVARAPKFLVDWIVREARASSNLSTKPRRSRRGTDEVFLKAGDGRWDACLRIGGMLREEGCGESVIHDALCSFVRNQCEGDASLRDEEMLRVARWLAGRPIGVAVKIEELMKEDEAPKVVLKEGRWRKKT